MSQKYNYTVYDSLSNEIVKNGTSDQVAEFLGCSSANVHIASKKNTLINKRYMVEIIGNRDKFRIPTKKGKKYDLFKGNTLLYKEITIAEMSSKTGLSKSCLYDSLTKKIKTKDGYSVKECREWNQEPQGYIVQDTPFPIALNSNPDSKRKPIFVLDSNSDFKFKSDSDSEKFSEISSGSNTQFETKSDFNSDSKIEFASEQKTQNQEIVSHSLYYPNSTHFAEVVYAALSEYWLTCKDLVENGEALKIEKEFFTNFSTQPNKEDIRDWYTLPYHEPFQLTSWEKSMLECYGKSEPFINHDILMNMKSKGYFKSVDDVFVPVGFILRNAMVLD